MVFDHDDSSSTSSESSPQCIHNNNNNILSLDKPVPLSPEELSVLAQLEEANRLIESDSKSFNSIPSNGGNGSTGTTPNGNGHGNGINGHSRKSSDTSELSLGSDKGGQGSDKGPEETEEDLWITWGRCVNEWDTYWKKKNQFIRELVKRGIPHHFRGIVWQLLCGAHDSPEKYKYAEYIKATSACEKVIRRDIFRTYPEHEFFKEKDGLGQESLFNVMKAYSLHDREVGYCQGSAFIVGLLLMQMPEEEAFAVVVKLMQDYRLREMFKPSMAEIGLCMYQLEMCVQEQLPELHVHFTSQGFHTSMYASSWFLTIYTTTLPLGIASRVMDLFLMDGIEVIFRIALAILTLAKTELLSMDMECMLRFLQKELPPRIEADEAETLFLLSTQVKYNARRMKKLEKEYAAMKTKEQEEMVELRRLRTENKLLKQRIEVLETESSELANKLIQGQVGRAEEVETTFGLKRELAAVRQHYLETMQHLEHVTQQYQNLLLVLDETNSNKQTSMDEISLKGEIIKQKEELIQVLQNELVDVRLKEAENAVIMSDLRTKIQELEEDKKKLRESVVDNSVAHLQEELIAVKLREAEASLSLKDLRHKVSDLTGQWKHHVQALEDNASENNKKAPLGNLFTSSRVEVQRLEEELMSLRLREMDTIIELKEHRLKTMELETQVQVTSNQLRRQEEENRRLKEDFEGAYAQIKEFQSKAKEESRKYTDLESKLKEDSVHARIKDAEKSQRMFDLSQTISSLKLKNQELLAEKELRLEKSSSREKLSTDSDSSDSPLPEKILQDIPNNNQKIKLKESSSLSYLDSETYLNNQNQQRNDDLNISSIKVVKENGVELH